MNITENAKKELLQYSQSASLRRDMQKVSLNRHNPFMKEGEVSVDAYVEFLCQFNEFINHASKPFAPFVEKDMKL